MNTKPDNPSDSIEIPLRHPGWAAFFGWLIPGAGHFYQGRYAKGGLFFCCILFTFFYGLFLGNGQVVYAAWRPGDYRWQYALQFGVGIPAMPAIAQYRRARKGEPAYFANRAFLIRYDGELIDEIKYDKGGRAFIVAKTGEHLHEVEFSEGQAVFVPETDKTQSGIETGETDKAQSGNETRDPIAYDKLVRTGWYSPPPGPIPPNKNCVLGLWNDELQHNFEIATLFTVVAGLLNLLAVYDAFAGPVLAREEDEEQPDSPEGFPTVTR